jgi:hypothetical protein
MRRGATLFANAVAASAHGSVPMLYHLLGPDERPASLFVGNREFDTRLM